MIDAAFVARHCTMPATLTTVTKSETEVDEANRPLEVTTDEPVKVLVYPETGSETRDGAQVATGREVAIIPACAEPLPTSRLTVRSTVYEFDGPPLEWSDRSGCRIGWQANLIRTS